MNRAAFHLAVLLAIGTAWGVTMPLSKIAVSTGHGHFGLMLWQLVVGAGAMTVIGLLRRRPLPLHRGALRTYAIIALIGAVIPNTLSYQAIFHLPAGIMSILMSTIPILAFPIALALALDRFEWRRLGGLLLGLLGVLLLVLPGAEVSGALPILWLLAALFVALCYGFEGNYVAKWGTAGCDALEVLWGATIFGFVIVLPLTLASGHWIDLRAGFGAPEQAQVTLSLISVLAYAGYVWLVRRAGPVFSVQVSFVVTVTGVLWSAALLEERYPSLVWASLVLLLAGMGLVQPRAGRLDAPDAMADTERT